MPCPCSKARRPMVGRTVRPRPESTGAAITAAASGSWATSCDPATPHRSLLAAQRAAKACGGRVVPAT